MRAAATRAVSLDPNLPEAHVALGAVVAFYEWNWSEGEKEFQRALALNPNLPLAHHWHAMLLESPGWVPGRAGTTAARAGTRADHSHHDRRAGQTLFRLGDNQRALIEFHKALELDSSLEYAHVGIGDVDERRGDYARAISEYRLVVKNLPRSTRAKAEVGYALAQAGNQSEAKQLLRELTTASQDRYLSPVFPAMIYAGLEDQEAALDRLEQAYDRGDPALCDLLRQWRFHGLSAHPRYTRLLQRMGLRPPAAAVPS